MQLRWSATVYARFVFNAVHVLLPLLCLINLIYRRYSMGNKVDYDLLHPSYKVLYDIVGEEGLLKIYGLYRGTQFQLPMKLYDRTALESAISDGNLKNKTVQEISLRYGFSPRWVQKIIAHNKGKV